MMEQAVRGMELAAAILFFAAALYVGKGMHGEVEKMYDALERNLRQERCVEERTHG